MKKQIGLGIIILVIAQMMISCAISANGFGLTTTVTYSGYVKDTSGNPLNSAYVALYDAGNNKIKGVYSTATGSYSLTATVNPLDILQLKASKSGY